MEFRGTTYHVHDVAGFWDFSGASLKPVGDVDKKIEGFDSTVYQIDAIDPRQFALIRYEPHAAERGPWLLLTNPAGGADVLLCPYYLTTMRPAICAAAS